MTCRTLIALLFGLFFSILAQAEVKTIDNTELVRLMSQHVPLIDIRTSGEWKSTGVIADSRLVTYSDEHGRVDKAQWLQAVKAVAKPDQPLILICRSGKRSQEAAELLSETGGYKTVYSVSNGLMRWLDERRPVIPAAATR